jgi:hypothetical protein
MQFWHQADPFTEHPPDLHSVERIMLWGLAGLRALGEGADAEPASSSTRGSDIARFLASAADASQ